MGDIDDELLALAGESSDEENEMENDEQQEDDKADEDDTPMVISRESSENAEEVEITKPTSKTNNSAPKAPREEDEIPLQQSSQGSNAMDDSDSVTSDDQHAEGELFPIEGKFKSVADQAEVLSMPEIKREEILAERAQQLERDRQTRALRQLLKARDLAAANKTGSKRKAVADPDDSTRRTSRQRTKIGGGRVGETLSGIDSLKRARAEKTDRQRRRAEDKGRTGTHHGGTNDESEGEAGAESEVEWDDPVTKRKSDSPVQKDAPLADLRDIERVRVGRSRFAQVCFYPGFDDTITGCFARINVAFNNETGQNVYRMAVIKGFTEGKPYGMEGPNGKQIVTNQYVRAAHGSSEREWPFITCSDQPFTEAELHRYTQTCLVDGVPLPIKSKLMAKTGVINALINRSWTEAELQEKLRKSGALNRKFLPLEKSRLNNAIKQAKEDQNEELVAKLEADLLALEGPKLAFGTGLKKSPPKATLSEQDRLAILNRENRRKNAIEVRQAQINERKAQAAIDKAIARGERVKVDHSKRLRTKAKLNHDVADDQDVLPKKEADATSPAVNKDAEGFDKATQPTGGKRVYKRDPTFEELVQGTDFEIDPEVEAYIASLCK